MGPIDYVLIEWPGRQPTGEAAPIVVDLVERGIIRVLDVALIAKRSNSCQVYCEVSHERRCGRNGHRCQQPRLTPSGVALGGAGSATAAVLRGSSSTGAAPAADPVQQLKELGELRDQGVLTEEEFAAQKAKILGS